VVVWGLGVAWLVHAWRAEQGKTIKIGKIVKFAKILKIR
jgi:hypothetical protein